MPTWASTWTDLNKPRSLNTYLENGLKIIQYFEGGTLGGQLVSTLPKAGPASKLQLALKLHQVAES